MSRFDTGIKSDMILENRRFEGVCRAAMVSRDQSCEHLTFFMAFFDFGHTLLVWGCQGGSSCEYEVIVELDVREGTQTFALFYFSN